jgi:hypothetical protein
MSEAEVWEKVWNETATLQSPPDMFLITVVTLKWEGKEYEVRMSFKPGYPIDSAIYFWEEGNFGCDCNRRLWIEKYHPGTTKAEVCHPDNTCGDTIEVTAFRFEFADKGEEE